MLLASSGQKHKHIRTQTHTHTTLCPFVLSVPVAISSTGQRETSLGRRLRPPSNVLFGEPGSWPCPQKSACDGQVAKQNVCVCACVQGVSENVCMCVCVFKGLGECVCVRGIEREIVCVCVCVQGIGFCLHSQGIGVRTAIHRSPFTFLSRPLSRLCLRLCLSLPVCRQP